MTDLVDAVARAIHSAQPEWTVWDYETGAERYRADALAAIQAVAAFTARSPTTHNPEEDAAKALFFDGIAPPRGCPMPTWDDQPPAVKLAHRHKARVAIRAAGLCEVEEQGIGVIADEPQPQEEGT